MALQGAGELLGVNPNTLQYKMKKMGIPFRKSDRFQSTSCYEINNFRVFILPVI